MCSDICGMWWLVNLQLHSYTPSSYVLLCCQFLSSSQKSNCWHLEKEDSSWLQRDICSEGVDLYKHFYVHTLVREELGKRDPKRQKEKKVARNWVAGKKKEIQTLQLRVPFKPVRNFWEVTWKRVRGFPPTSRLLALPAHGLRPDSYPAATAIMPCRIP